MYVSVDEVIEAANKNGYIHCRNGWFKDDFGFSSSTTIDTTGNEDNPIVQACILGQVAINLGVDFLSLEEELNALGTVNNPWLKKQAREAGYIAGLDYGIAAAAIEYNDNSKRSYNEIARKLIDWLEPYRGKTLNMIPAKYIAKRKEE